MVEVDTSLKYALQSQNAKIVIGVPMEAPAAMTGTVNGSNRVFDFDPDNYPVFPKNMLSIKPQPEDVEIYEYKGTTLSTTPLAVTSITPTVDTATDRSVYGGVYLSTPPTTPNADSIYGSCVECMVPYKVQSIKEDIKQDTKEVGELGEDTKQTSYGSKSITVTIESIVADFEPTKKLGFDEYDGAGSVESGYKAYDMSEDPKPIYAYLNVERSGEFVGRYYFQGRAVMKDLFSLKVGDNPTASIELAIDETPRLILTDPDA